MSQSASRPLKNVNKVSTNQNQEKVENRFRGPKSFWYGLVSWYMSSRDHKLALKLEGGSGFASLAVPFCHRTRFCLVQNESYAHTMRGGRNEEAEWQCHTIIDPKSCDNIVITLLTLWIHKIICISTLHIAFSFIVEFPGFQNNSSPLKHSGLKTFKNVSYNIIQP